ncbi:MAG: 2OG-Fe(II) oxygenase [Candidatus Acidiferrales bacterium]
MLQRFTAARLFNIAHFWRRRRNTPAAHPHASVEAKEAPSCGLGVRRTILLAHPGWNAAMKIEVRYPHRHEEFLERCHDAGRRRPTPFLLESAKVMTSGTPAIFTEERNRWGAV